ncbi:hypothetical protein TNCT_137641 [Trichonephila clavata]|uniref:Uncharacterized protein n=1 Tax=Trichonephila clavata TaxID=2740835 RepID=A0A8X6FPG9_TRICU|nr:hypothetical protein TNCT_137641 [Trichonephila clavata]
MLAEIKLFMLRSLLKYSKAVAKILPDYDPDLITPIMIVGDSNVNDTQNRPLPVFMVGEFNLSCIETSTTTLGNTCIDLTFTRISMYPVCHFCYTYL